MNYSYLVQKTQILRNLYQNTLGQVVNASGASFIRDIAEFGCRIIASDASLINSQKQRDVIRDCLNVSITASDVYKYQTSNQTYIAEFPDHITASLTFDFTLKQQTTQLVLDFMSEFAYCIMCADERFSAVQEGFLNRCINNIITDGNAFLRHYRLNKPMPTMSALGENPQRDPFKRRYLYGINEQMIVNELTAHRIPTTPIYKYKSFGHPFYVALYPSNSIQGDIAIVAGKNLYVLNLFEMDISDCTVSAYNDMEGIHKSVVGGMVGGPAWGAFLAAVSQNHTIIEEISCTITDKSKNEKFQIIFSKNEKFSGNEWETVFNAAKGFTDNYLSVMNRVTNIEAARKVSYKTYGWECDTLTRNYLKKQGHSADGKDFKNIG